MEATEVLDAADKVYHDAVQALHAFHVAAEGLARLALRDGASPHEVRRLAKKVVNAALGELKRQRP